MYIYNLNLIIKIFYIFNYFRQLQRNNDFMVNKSMILRQYQYHNNELIINLHLNQMFKIHILLQIFKLIY